jgi:signal peptidase II
MEELRRAGIPGMLPWLALAAAVIVADQASKAAVLQTLAPGGSMAVSPYFNLVLAFNRGAAFSFLSDAGGWQGYAFAAIALVASAVIVRLLLRHGRQPVFAAGLGLILGGALGNLTDRMRHGHVVDFLDFHWRWLEPLFPGGHFPAFNLADSAICAGVALLILDELLRKRPPSADHTTA